MRQGCRAKPSIKVFFTWRVVVFRYAEFFRPTENNANIAGKRSRAKCTSASMLQVEETIPTNKPSRGLLEKKHKNKKSIQHEHDEMRAHNLLVTYWKLLKVS